MNVEIAFFCDVYRMFWGVNVAFLRFFIYLNRTGQE